MANTQTLEELLATATHYAQSIASHTFHILLLSGTLGAGKTTFAQAVLRELGVKERITSPTYTLGNTYETKKHTIYHLDLYRIPTLDDYMHLGFHDILSHHIGIWIIEWPELLLQELQGFPYTHITITPGHSEETRTITQVTHTPSK